MGVVKPTGFWSNSNTFFISCLFLLNARPCNGSVTGSFHTQPCSRPTPLGSNQGEPSPRRNFCVSSCTFKVSQRPPPPAPPSPPRTPRTSHVWKQSPTSGAATATRKGLKHQPNKHAHTQFSREQDGNLLVLARRVRRPDPRGSRPGAGMQTAEAPRWRGARSGRGLAGNAGQRRAGVYGGGSSVIRALITFMKASPLDTITLRDSISTQEFWRGHVQTIPITHGGINCILQAGELLSPPHTNPAEILYIEGSGETVFAPSPLTGNLAVT